MIGETGVNVIIASVTTATGTPTEPEVCEEIQNYARPDGRNEQVVHGLPPRQAMRDSNLSG